MKFPFFTISKGWVTYRFSHNDVYIMSHIMTFWNSEKLSYLKDHLFQFVSLIFISSSMVKDHLSIKKVIKIYETNQRLNLGHMFQ